ncbi:MOSC domain-containing protein [Arcobacteraceae bacterium]|nr:MOSC domain-containing protein [Arcobacteraceae bacterium]
MTLEHIIIGKEAKKPLSYVDSVKAVVNQGLEGDRYFYKQGTFNKPQLDQTVREISILPFESLSLCNNRIDSHLDFLDLRRNLIIKEFDYETLKDKVFCIGEVHFKIVRTCPPCRYLSRLLDVDMMVGLKYIGGYRATILKSGTIKVGDTLTIV